MFDSPIFLRHVFGQVEEMGGTVKATARTTRPRLTLVRGTGETAARGAGRTAPAGVRPVPRPRGAGRTVSGGPVGPRGGARPVRPAVGKVGRAPVRLTRRGRVVVVLTLALLILVAFWAGALVDAAFASGVCDPRAS
ncbi:hypothetical protein [Streptosporangium saharense]|uniref:hypothetical protein n=1 Tax=Streptosporangium saharense TaxID=1706840 RepID=UPI00369ED8A8